MPAVEAVQFATGRGFRLPVAQRFLAYMGIVVPGEHAQGNVQPRVRLVALVAQQGEIGADGRQ